MKKSIDELFVMISCTEADSFDPNDVISDEVIIDEISTMEQIDQTDRSGMNLLMFSACRERVKLVEYLIARGLNVNSYDKYGNTPLHFAVQSNNIEIIKILINNGADVNSVDNNGNSVITRCTYVTPLNVFKILIESGADPFLKNEYGVSAVDVYAAREDILDILRNTRDGSMC